MIQVTERQPPYRHACKEWGEMVIDVSDPEFDQCLCFGMTADMREALTFLRNMWLNAESEVEEVRGASTWWKQARFWRGGKT